MKNKAYGESLCARACKKVKVEKKRCKAKQQMLIIFHMNKRKALPIGSNLHVHYLYTTHPTNDSCTTRIIQYFRLRLHRRGRVWKTNPLPTCQQPICKLLQRAFKRGVICRRDIATDMSQFSFSHFLVVLRCE